MTTADLIKYYCQLLIVQYYTKAKANAHVSLLVGEVIADQITSQLSSAFVIASAAGAQLDLLAKWVGVQRRINGLDITRNYFTLPGYGDADASTVPGLGEYGTPPEAQWRIYADLNNSYNCTDEELRQLILLKIQLNKSDHSLLDIDTIIDTFFGAYCLVTDTTMSLTYAFQAGITGNLAKIAAFTGNLPRPGGVEITITGV